MTRGIATSYRGRVYRSRLEARWACLFDLLGWRHEYEPLDLAAYLPDFAIWPGACGGEVALLAEVRPPIGRDWADGARAKLAASGWTGRSIVLGSTMECDDDGYLRAGGARWAHCGACKGTTLAREACLRCGHASVLLLAPGAPGITSLWVEAANATQWRAPLSTCPRCGVPEIDFGHRIGCRG